MRKAKPDPTPPRKSLVDALFPKVRQEIFAAVFLHPEAWWYLSDLARHTNRTASSLQRELASLLEVGILESRTEANRVYYRPNPGCPVFPELQGLAIKTVGLVDVLAQTLAPLEDSFEFAFVYGSLARGDARSDSDIDLMFIGTVTLRKLTGCLKGLRDRLRREINPSIFPFEEFQKRLRDQDPFLENVLDGAKLFVRGGEDELRRALAAR